MLAAAVEAEIRVYRTAEGGGAMIIDCFGGHEAPLLAGNGESETVRIGVPTPDFPTAPHASSHRGADGDAVEKSLEGMAPSGSLSAHTPCAPCGYSRSAPTRGEGHTAPCCVFR